MKRVAWQTPREVLSCLAACLLVAGWASSAPAATEKDVEKAIARIKHYLWAVQDPERGHWEIGPYAKGSHRGGTTALITSALLASGESFQQPRLRKAIDYLQRQSMRTSYSVSCRAHVWAQLPDEFNVRLRADVRHLMSMQSRAWFGYSDAGSGNLSTTHFGALGVWEGSKRGVAVSPLFWRQLERTHRKMQTEAGGFGYLPGRRPSASMTAAGLTMLLIAREEIDRNSRRPSPKLREAIQNSINWLDNFYIGPTNTGGNEAWLYYYLYALERISLACGIRHFNGRDWFDEGVEFILERQEPFSAGPQRAGSIEGNPVSTAFSLLFLSRGRVPVWATKIHVPGYETDNCPNDLHMLTRRISDLAERPFNWQRVDLELSLNVEDLNTPMVFLASNKAVELNSAQRDILKQYIERGGTLVASPDGASPVFSKSIVRLGQQIFPQYELQAAGPEHPLLSSLHQMSHITSQPVFCVNNGARDLIILADRDWSYQWQAQNAPPKTMASRLPINLWMLLTNGGDLPPRLHEGIEPRVPGDESDRLLLARARYAGNWCPEPQAWRHLSRQLFNAGGTQLVMEDVMLTELSDDLPVVHLTGVEPVDLAPSELEAIVNYARQGGTILIETVGGHGGFARHVMRQLEMHLEYAAIRIDSDHPLISGEGLEHGTDNRRVRYQRYAVIKMSLLPRPRLAAFHVGDRPAILISDEDLTLGALGARRWGVLGYQAESARGLMMNLLLWAQQRQKERFW